MREGHGSRTAEHNALFRALESARPAGARLADDPLAGAFLAWPLAPVARLARIPALRERIIEIIDRRWPGVRSSLVARTRLIDDLIGDVLEEGIEQIVVLGAGFDSRAYRLPALRTRAVFEVDHPDTQARKRRALERVLGRVPAHVRFVAIDFVRQDLPSVMAATELRASERALFLWEGVTNYLTEAAVDATLRWCARAASGSPLLFTYVHRDVLTHPESFVGSKNLFASLERAGERFTFGIEPSQLRSFLASRGFTLESDIGAAEYRERYYGAAAREMHGHEFYRVALARVA